MLVTEETEEADPDDCARILAEINRVAPIELPVPPECRQLADEYIKAGVLPAKKRADAMHVAVASISGMDILVSWNHRHLANDRKREQFNAVNRLAGREQLLVIHTPFEVMR